MNKTCAFLGNDYDFTHGKKRLRRPDLALRLRVQAQIVDLIENEDVDTFLVGEIGGFEEDAYESVLEVKKSYPDIKIILVISKLAELHPTGLDDRHLIYRGKYFDDFILPDKCALGYKRLGIVYRNRYIIEHADFIVAYNERHGRAFEFCKRAENKGVRVIELART
ncbi:MAG: hypothetical protein IJS26_04980 [Alphaproteobacteria bacterium]|nr:hypothetical protein [Alphaproteobacteria bacterium]